MAEKMSIAKVLTRGAHEGFTPYMIATMVNAALEKAGLEQIRPQMMYNYDKNGIINGVKNQNKDRGYTTAEMHAFVERFVAMRAKKAAAAPQIVQVASAFSIEDVETAAAYQAETNPVLELDEIEA